MSYKTFLLKDLVKIKYGKNQKNVETKISSIPIYGTGGLMGYANEFLYDKPSVLIGRKGTIGKVKYVEHPFWTVDTLFYTIVDETKVFPKYLFYALSLIDLNIYNEGTTIPSLRTETLNRIEVKIPSLSIQEKILSILNPLDLKIALNNQINKNLENQALSIYYNWKKELKGKLTVLQDVVDVRDGTHDSPKSQNNGYPLVTSKHLNEYGVDLSTPNKICKSDFDKINERSKVDTYDILMSMIGTVGLISFISQQEINFAIKNVALFKTSQNLNIVYYVLLFLKSSETKNYINTSLAGSTQQYISLSELRKMPILIPNDTELSKLNNFLKPLITLICKNTDENMSLIKLRDTLLPKLLSGEISL